MSEAPKNHYLAPWQVYNIDVHLDTLPLHFYQHRHNFYEIYVVISGNGREIINGHEFLLKRGTITFLLPWHIHELFSDEHDTVRLIRCNFGMETVMEKGDINSGLMGIIHSQLYADPSIQLPPEHAEVIINRFESLLAEFNEFKPWKEVMLKSMITGILVGFNRAREELQKINKNEVEEKEQDISSNILAYIHLNWNQNMVSSEIADKFGISTSELDGYCRADTGMDFPEYVNEVRIRYCCSLLSNSDLKISEISDLAGYNSINTFNRSFRNRKGLTPTEYRKHNHSMESSLHVNRAGFPSPLMWRIYNYIQLHYNDEISLPIVAKEFHYSEASISEICKREARQNFVDILHEVRIFHSCSLLASTELEVTQIGFEVGFNSSESFFRVFKKYMGMTPNEYRKQNSHPIKNPKI